MAPSFCRVTNISWISKNVHSYFFFESSYSYLLHISTISISKFSTFSYKIPKSPTLYWCGMNNHVFNVSIMPAQQLHMEMILHLYSFSENQIELKTVARDSHSIIHEWQILFTSLSLFLLFLALLSSQAGTPSYIMQLHVCFYP